MVVSIISIISIILLVIFSIILLSFYKRQVIKLRKRTEEQVKEKYEEYIENKILEEKRIINIAADEYREAVLQQQQDWLDSLRQERSNVERSLNERKQAVEEIIEQIENRWREAEKNYNDIITNEKEKINKELEFYRKNKIEGIETRVQFEFAEKTAAANKAHEELVASLLEQKKQKENELAILLEEIDDFKKKQSVINEEILRRREVEEKQEFFKIKLPECDKQDIKYLLSVIDNIKNSTLVYKLIWSEYIQKPFNQMTKNITGGKEIKCVIYKITNTNTGEIYIGKTKADVTKRWTEHIKTSLNIGTVARSKIHNALFNHWDEFTFEILEKVDDETKLSTREKFYINFYESNIYGYNMNSGG